jgi:hypothetical protein
LGQGGAKYRSGSLVRRCDADFEPGRAGAHGSRADPIDRKNGERDRIRRFHLGSRRKSVHQDFSPISDARPAA